MLPKKISFVDIETTGGRSFYDRIIEIGIIRIEDNVIVNQYQSLINPNAHIPREIEMLTGITSRDLENAPTFRQIKNDVLEILADSFFVAHNVRFDYGFLKSEFRRVNISFSQKHFCTVRLSRLLYPEHKRHNLDSIIERFGFDCTNRHRAMDDARVLFDFYSSSYSNFPAVDFENAISKCLKKPSTPLNLPSSVLENLPEQPGVYVFYAESGMPLYVGKSINLRERILSHFSSDIHSPTEMKISQQIASIETITTGGELGALILESQMIKKLLPLYNKISRIKRELIAIKSRTNKDGYMETYIEPILYIDPNELSDKNDEKLLGFFRSRRLAKEYLTTISQKYSLCEKLMGLEKTHNACFGYRLSKCNGACIAQEKPIFYNMRFTQAFTSSIIKPWPYDGPITIEEKSLEGISEYFLIDKWCYLGKMKIDEYGLPNNQLRDILEFDLDIYKIIKRYLREPKNHKKIKSASGLSPSLSI